MPRLVRLPPALHEPFSVAQARAAGVGYGRTRSADLISPFHGVRSRADAPVADSREKRIADRARLYLPRLSDGQFFCEATACALFGLPLPWQEHDDVVHVGVAPPRRAPRTRGVVGHQLLSDRLDLRLEVTMPVCSPLDAWRQCAARMTVVDLIVLGDALVRRKFPLVTPEQLTSYVGAHAGYPGVARLGRALTLIRPGTDSPKESQVRLIIVRHGMPEPEVNSPVRDSNGGFLGLGDLVLEKWKIVIEYDGGYHFASDEQIHADIDRLARFTAAGWTAIRVHKYHLRNPANLAARVREALERAGWRQSES